MNKEFINKLNLIGLDKVPKDYIRNKLGIYPKEWKVETLGELCNKITDGTHKTPSYKDTGVKFISAKNIISNKIDWKDVKYISEEEHKELIKRCNPEDGDIVLSKSGTLGTPAVIDKKFEFSLFESLALLKYDRKLVNGNYLFQYLLSPNIQRVYHLETKGLSIKHLHLEEIRKFKLILPSLEEQKKISNVLSYWDKGIELKEKLLQERQKQKKGLMERLLTGKIRLSGFNEKIKMSKLKNFIEEIKERNKDNTESRILSVTNKQGFILQEEQFERIVASSDLSNYKIVRKGQFAYNPSRVNVGSLDLLTRFDSGLLSPMYVIFECINGLNSEYLYQFLSSDLFLKYIPRLLQGSVRDSLSFDALQQVKLFIPSIEEQKEIGDFLRVADNELNLLQKEIELLKEQKKGLMQLLLTGVVRVKCD